MVVVFVSALVLAQWHNETAAPVTHQLFDPQFRIFMIVAGVCAGLAVIGAVTSFLLASIDSAAIPSTGELLCGRFLFAALQILATAITGVLDPAPHQFLRTSDVCFFSIAVSGPAILDLIHCKTKPATLRGVWSLPPLALIGWASTLLGFWYFVRLVPMAPGVEIMEALRVNAIVSAIFAFAVGAAVQYQVSARPRKGRHSR
jgi:hypothetical protein